MNPKNTELHFVVMNHEEQYSIWPHWKDVPLGWKIVGEAMPKDACLEYIEKVWVDMRPLSLRNHLADIANHSVDPKSST